MNSCLTDVFLSVLKRNFQRCAKRDREIVMDMSCSIDISFMRSGLRFWGTFLIFFWGKKLTLQWHEGHHSTLSFLQNQSQICINGAEKIVVAICCMCVCVGLISRFYF